MVFLTEWLPPWVFATVAVASFVGLFVVQLAAHPLIRINRLPIQFAL